MLAAVFRDQPAPELQAQYLWPCNVQAWQLWTQLQTQWRVGMGGATGLDYSAVRAWFDEMGLEGDTRRECWAGVRACERATLDAWASQRD